MAYQTAMESRMEAYALAMDARQRRDDGSERDLWNLYVNGARMATVELPTWRAVSGFRAMITGLEPGCDVAMRLAADDCLVCDLASGYRCNRHLVPIVMVRVGALSVAPVQRGAL